MGPDRRIVFRTGAGPAVGAGHVMRCLALAGELERLGVACGFATDPGSVATVPALAGVAGVEMPDEPESEPAALGRAWPEGAAVLVVDHYRRDACFERACRPWARRIAVIDDLADRCHDADLLFDPTPSRQPEEVRTLVPPACRLRLGPGYALLRSGFAGARANRQPAAAGGCRLLVAFGATDPDNETGQTLEALAAARLALPVTVLLGGAAGYREAVVAAAARLAGPVRVLVDVAEPWTVLAEADLAVGAVGTSVWERCCVGLPSILVVSDARHRRIAAALMDAGVAVVVPAAPGWPAAVAAVVSRLAGYPGSRQAMARAALAVCDGQGAVRAAAALVALAS